LSCRLPGLLFCRCVCLSHVHAGSTCSGSTQTAIDGVCPSSRHALLHQGASSIQVCMLLLLLAG
jgi:hypothetical protein